MTHTAKGPPREGCADGPDEIVCFGGERSSNTHLPRKKQGKSGGRASRDKGNRLERAIVKLLQDHGLGAERVPLSGSARCSYLGDLTVPLLGRDLVVECKSRASGFCEFYSWLQGRDLLIIKADRREPLVVLPLRLAIEIALAAERGKA
jgi:Holliday junction resolvase